MTAETKSHLVRAIVGSLFGFAIFLYFLQIFGPLRLTTDSIYYLSMADSAAGGHGFVASAQPVGYPVFVFLLIKAGLFSAPIMVAANCLLFLLGLAFSFWTLVAVGFERRLSMIACLLTLLAFGAVKHITQGMSDFLFFALSACACWIITRDDRWKWAVIAILVFAAIEVRMIGVALLFPLAALAWPYVKNSPALLAIAATGLLAGLGAGVWAGHHYLALNVSQLSSNGWIRFLWLDLTAHFQDFGELIVNAPLSKLPAWFRVPTLVIGAFALLLFLAGIVVVRRRSRWLSWYLIGCCVLVLPWPYTDPRFWLPVLPFVFVAMLDGLRAALNRAGSNPQTLRPCLVAYTVVFLCLGFAALGYSTWITFSGSQFPYRYGDGLLRSTYLTGCSAPGADIDHSALHLLRQYEWHCRETSGIN